MDLTTEKRATPAKRTPVEADHFAPSETACCAVFAKSCGEVDEGALLSSTHCPSAILIASGGHQWYFVCPVMNRCCSVLWRPPGATRFCCRQTWGRRVAYASQFLGPDNRAHRGKGKIKARLIADLDPEECELPPKPKWTRWRTYNQYEERFDKYEAILEDGIEGLIARLLSK